MKYLISLFLITPIIIFSQKTEDKVLKDSRISITVTKVERAPNLSDSIIKEFNISSKQLPVTEEGYDFVWIHITITQIKNVHLVSFGGRGDELSSLSDTDDHNYKLHSWQAKGLKFSDPHDMTSPVEYIEGAKCFLLFEVPQINESAHIKFVYYYKNKLTDNSKKVGAIDIQL